MTKREIIEAWLEDQERRAATSADAPLREGWESESSPLTYSDVRVAPQPPARTCTSVESEEALGPVDMGPLGRWAHLCPAGTDAALCGHDCTGFAFSAPPGGSSKYRVCPDCVRIGRALGYRV